MFLFKIHTLRLVAMNPKLDPRPENTVLLILALDACVWGVTWGVHLANHSTVFSNAYVIYALFPISTFTIAKTSEPSLRLGNLI